MAAGLIIGALLLQAGCSGGTGPSTDGTDDGFMTYSQVVDEYNTAQASLPLAPGDQYPPFTEGYDQQGRYEAMYGKSIAFGVYMCSWEEEWLNTRTADAGRASKALGILQAMPDNPIFKATYDDDLQAEIIAAFDKAALGDPSEVQSWADAC